MIDLVFAQTDPQAALTIAAALTFSGIFVLILHRFTGAANKAENARIDAAVKAAEDRCDRRCNDLEGRCKDLDNHLWVAQQQFRDAKRELMSWRDLCISSDCPVRTLKTNSGPP